ncbi:MAG: nickel-dependent lactate racemase [Chloroflexi bacterium]|nr:nickel-dependent lactate racemase [Chloroflexota bacterium]
MSGEIRPSRALDGLELYHVRQRWQQPCVLDIERSVNEQLSGAGFLDNLKPGGEVAITAGSRGIADIALVLRAVVRAVRARGGSPFIFPAMGSHGGGTAQGQRAMLAELGITEQIVEAPIRATMDVVQLGCTNSGTPVYLDALAARAGGIIVVNRIKKHTNLDGAVESGLCKMMAVGMGKHAGAAAIHRLSTSAMAVEIIPCAQVMLAHAPILGGLAVLEGAAGQIAELAALRRDEIIEREPALLARAKTLAAAIPFKHIDIALVERMGKEISGTGMDCHVIGRRRIIGEPEWNDAPQIHSLVLLDLTAASHGNAVGVGLADFTTQRLADSIDWEVTKANVLTSGNLERVKLPLVYTCDRDALEAAAFRERALPLGDLRFVNIRDTLHLRDLVISTPLLRESNGLEVITGPFSPRFESSGNWLSRLG